MLVTYSWNNKSPSNLNNSNKIKFHIISKVPTAVPCYPNMKGNHHFSPTHTNSTRNCSGHRKLVVLTFNPLSPGVSWCNLKKNVIFILVLLIGIFRSYDNTLGWMPWKFTDYKSTLVQVMAWFHQATSHYFSQRLCCHMASLGHNDM